MTQSVQNRLSPAEQGRRLSEARRSRNLSQDDVAQRLSVSRPTLVAIEKGTRPVRPDELILLAKLYGRTVHELVRSREFVADFTPMFRIPHAGTGAGVSQDVVDESVKAFKMACEDYLSLESIVGSPMPRYTYPDRYELGGVSAHAAAEDAAMNERSRLNLGLGPLNNLLETLENEVGLRVFVLPLNEFKIAGIFAYTDQLGGCILVNGAHPLTRQNWSMAHEYAHFLQDRFKEDITILIEYDRKPKVEQFADAFAAGFLMPGAGLRQRFRRIVQSRGDFTVADLCLLADQYAVSVEAMARRLESLGCMQGGTWDNLRSKGFDGSRIRKQLGLQPHPSHRVRLPERYVRLAVQAFEEENITESELMRLLHCSRVEARETVDRLVRPMDVGASGEQFQLDLDYGDTLGLAHAERMG